MKQLKSNVKEVKEIMVDNIGKILEREQKVEILVQRTADINSMATTYKKSVNFQKIIQGNFNSKTSLLEEY